ncbi:MAG: hypothetical protein V3V29_09415 [Acidimicrobiia bacterium]
MSGPELPLPDDDLAWDPDLATRPEDLAVLDDLVAGSTWDGPLIVSMPRTGSTLLGALFLLLRDSPGTGEHVFERYLHEPVAPVFWEGQDLQSVKDFIATPLTERDLIQESAYQFASKDVARWFLRRARKPIAFVMRHPRLAWPSRWQIMLSEWLATDPEIADADRIRATLEAGDYRGLGDVLIERVRQPDNGWCGFMSLIGLCLDEGLDFVIVDNERFRADPETTLRQMCERWGLTYDDAMTTWDDLSEALPRVVMSELALGPEYEWYYAQTLASKGGIVRVDREPLDVGRFPEELRGDRTDLLTIDRAEEWYEALLDRGELMG